MKTLLAVCFALLGALQAGAIFTIGNSVSNTVAPTEDSGCGWYSTVKCGPGLWNVGTVINTRFGITAGHVEINVGDTVRLGNTNYTVTNVFVSPSGRLKVFKTMTPFPTNTIAKVYTNANEVGKNFYAFGQGPARGRVITSVPLIITEFTSCGATNAFNIVGGKVGGTLSLEWSTNLTQWHSLTNIYTVPAGQCLHVEVPQCGEAFGYYRAKGTGLTLITNGWERIENSQGTLRWGKNSFNEIDGNGFLVSTFDLGGSGGLNECAIWSYDSGGGCFTKSGTNYVLTAVIDSTPAQNPYRTQLGEVVYGPMCDMRGLDWVYPITQSEYGLIIQYPITGGPLPVQALYSRISPEYSWLKQVAGLK